MAVRRNNTPRATGPFNAEDKFQFRHSIREGGGIRENPRGSKNVEFKAKVPDGLRVTKSKILSFAQRSLPSSQIISEDLYFKRSKGAPQSQYVMFTEEIFSRLTKDLYCLLSQSDASSWFNDGKNAMDELYFELSHARIVEHLIVCRLVCGRKHLAVQKQQQVRSGSIRSAEMLG